MREPSEQEDESAEEGGALPVGLMATVYLQPYDPALPQTPQQALRLIASAAPVADKSVRRCVRVCTSGVCERPDGSAERAPLWRLRASRARRAASSAFACLSAALHTRSWALNSDDVCSLEQAHGVAAPSIAMRTAAFARGRQQSVCNSIASCCARAISWLARCGSSALGLACAHQQCARMLPRASLPI